MNAGLLLAIAVTHYGYDALSILTGVSPEATYYILRGFEGAIFLACLVFGRERPDKVICGWGVAEELMTSICGGSYVVDPVTPGLFEALCDSQTGLPVSPFGLAVTALVTAVYYSRRV